MLSESKKRTNKKQLNAIIDNSIKDYGNDPYFIKKGKESKAFLEKHGFPKELLVKK